MNLVSSAVSHAVARVLASTTSTVSEVVSFARGLPAFRGVPATAVSLAPRTSRLWAGSGAVARRIPYSLGGLAFAVICLGALAACSRKSAPPSADKKSLGAEAIPIGLYRAVSGDDASWGQQTDESLQLVFDEINRTGIAGRQLRLIKEDDASDPSQAVNVAVKLITSDQVVALLGETSSTRSIAVAPHADRYHVPMLTTGATNPRVTQDESGKTRPYVFRTTFIDDFQGQVMARFAMKRGFRRMALFIDSSHDYSVGIAKYFKEEYRRLGGEIVAEESYHSGNQNDFGSQFVRMRSSHPDAYFIPDSSNKMNLIARNARGMGVRVPLLGGDGWDGFPAFFEGDTSAIEGCFYSTHFAPDDPLPRVQNFIRQFKQQTGHEPGSFTVWNREPALVLIDALKRVAKDKPQVFQAGGRPLSEALRDALETTKGVPGVMADIDIGPDHNAKKPAVVLEIRDGKPHWVETVNP